MSNMFVAAIANKIEATPPQRHVFPETVPLGADRSACREPILTTAPGGHQVEPIVS